jgi:hypothetical protein
VCDRCRYPEKRPLDELERELSARKKKVLEAQQSLEEIEDAIERNAETLKQRLPDDLHELVQTNRLSRMSTKREPLVNREKFAVTIEFEGVDKSFIIHRWPRVDWQFCSDGAPFAVLSSDEPANQKVIHDSTTFQDVWNHILDRNENDVHAALASLVVWSFLQGLDSPRLFVSEYCAL